MDKSNWGAVRNLKAPVNSGADDFGYVVDYISEREEEVLQVGYFTSSRKKGTGNDDIYRFEKRKATPPPPPPPVKDTVTTPIPPAIVYKMILNVFILEKIYENPDDPNSRVLGRRPLNDAKVEVVLGYDSKTMNSGDKG